MDPRQTNTELNRPFLLLINRSKKTRRRLDDRTLQRLSVYQHFDQQKRAVGLAVAALATTDPDIFTEFQASIKYRQRLWRDWLYFEVEPEAIFPEERDYNFTPRVNVRFDVIYGDYRY